MTGSQAPTPQVTNTTTKSDPWAPTQPYWNQIFSQGQQALAQTSNKPYTGDFIAAPNQTQQQAVTDMTSLAPTLSQGAAPLRQMALDEISGKYLDPSTNTAMQGSINAALDPIFRNFNQVTLPGMVDQGVAQGAYGGSRQDIAKSNASFNLGQGASEALSPMLLGEYNTERGLQQNAPQLLQAANTLDMTPITMEQQAGAMQQGFDQSALDNAYAKYQTQMQAPWNGLAQFGSLLQGAGGGETTTQGTVTPSQPSFNPLASMFQGGAGGMGLASAAMMAIPGLQPFALPLMLAGAGAGAAAGSQR